MNPLHLIFDFILQKALVTNEEGEENYQIKELRSLVESEKFETISCFIDRDNIIQNFVKREIL